MKNKVAVIQAGSVPFDSKATTNKAVDFIKKAADGGAKLALFPEAFIGTYPKGLTFDTPIGTRFSSSREEFKRYYNSAIDLDGPEIIKIEKAAKEHDIDLIIGIIERDGGTLYCTAIFISPKGGLCAKHRKLMPTALERLIWGQGDGSTLPCVETSVGRAGSVICWENYMPLLRMAMYEQKVQLYCVPTADDRDTWVSTMQHIALEGRCFVLSSCQYITRDDFPEDYNSILSADKPLMRGGSMIVDPLGNIIAGPIYNKEDVLFANIDLNEIIKGNLDFDAVGHYSRPDIFKLIVDTDEKKPVELKLSK